MGGERLAALAMVFGACAFQPGVPLAPPADPGGGPGAGAGGGAGAIAFDSRSETMVKGASIARWDHTVGDDVTDGLLVVGASVEKQSGAVVSSITYAGQPLVPARVAVGGEGVRAELWYLIGPPPGTAQVVMTLSASVDDDGAVGGAVSLSGVDPTNPIPTTATGGATSGSPSTTIEVANDNAWVLDVMTVDTGVTATTSGVQLQRWSLAELITGSGSTLGASSRGTHTMSWSGESDNWAQVVAEIKPL